MRQPCVPIAPPCYVPSCALALPAVSSLALLVDFYSLKSTTCLSLCPLALQVIVSLLTEPGCALSASSVLLLCKGVAP